MEDESILDISDDVHLFSLYCVYVPRINRSLNEFIQQMNNHPVSTENNQSPLQMWERGMLENMHSGHTALSSEEIEDFGVDLGGVPSVEEEDYQVNVISPTIELTELTLVKIDPQHTLCCGPLLKLVRKSNNIKMLFFACFK